MPNRRNFLRQSALAFLSSTIIPDLVNAANSATAAGTPKGQADDGATIVFQGDSITDAGRDKGRYYSNDASGMGNGYVHHIVTELLGKNPGKNFRCYNRGISGHKVFQLADRWEDDCLQLRPDVLSILIGVNDFWHTLTHGYQGTVKTYETDFRKLLERTKEELPEVRLIIGEPFTVAGGSAIDDRWKALDDYRKAAKSISENFGAVFIPYHRIFEEALKSAPASYWCPDGVHPSLAGAYLMAQAWLEGFGKIK